MTIADPEQVLARLRKLLALAEGNASEHESLAAMAQVHRLLAEHNLSLADVRARGSEAPRRTIDETQVDVAAEPWTRDLWHATAALFFCRYFYRAEGGARPTAWRHCLIGTPANQVTAKVMADHFCRTVRRLARAYGGTRAARASFTGGCADRLRERIWARQGRTARAPSGGGLPALLDLYDRERAANEAALAALGVTLEKGKPPARRKRADVLAEHHGRAAAEDVSLALQLGDGAPAPRRAAGPAQMGFAF